MRSIVARYPFTICAFLPFAAVATIIARLIGGR